MDLAGLVFCFHNSTFIVCLFIIVASLIWYYGTMNYNYWNEKKIVNDKPFFPFLGNLKLSDFTKTNEELLRALYDRASGKGYTGIYFLTSPAFFVRDPDIIKRILVSDFNNFISRGFHTNPDIDPLSNNIIHLNYPVWKAVRSSFSSSFSKKKMKLMINEVDILAEKVVEKIGMSTEGKPFECVDVLLRYTLDLVVLTMFGVDSGALEDKASAFNETSLLIFNRYHFLFHAWTGFLFPTFHRLFRMTVARGVVTKFFATFTKDLISLSRKKKSNTEFVQSLIDLLDEQNNRMNVGGETEEELGNVAYDENFATANVFMFVAAGFDSTGKIAAFSLYELALNENIQTKARNEIKEVLKKHAGVTFEALSEMTYLDQIVAETNRKYPILPMIFRKCDKHYELPCGGILEPGIPIMIPTLAIHYDPQYYPDPEKFDPDRFSENNNSSIHPGTYLSFGIGPRLCMAWQFAPMVIKLLLMKILIKYKVKLHPSIKVPIKFKPRTFLLDPEHEILIFKEDI